MLRDTLPSGFRRASAASGLLVPEDTPRQREVWTKDEGRLLDRAFSLLQSRGIVFNLGCSDAKCVGEPMERVGTPAGFTLRCNHKDRIFQRKI